MPRPSALAPLLVLVALAAASCQGRADPAARRPVEAAPEVSAAQASGSATATTAPSPAPTASAARAALGASAAPAESAAPSPRLPDHPPIEPLLDAGKDIGVVSVPGGATGRRPLVVALHGGSDKPEWACSEWRGATEGHAFVVCPRGKGPPAGLHWSDPKDTLAAIDRAVAAVTREHGAWIAEGDRTLVGFSIGASQAVHVVAMRPGEYPRVALSEGAYDLVDGAAFASGMAKAGVRRLLLSCTTVGRCGASYRGALSRLAKAGVEARVNLAGNLGHGLYLGAIQSIERDWGWFVAGAPSWSGFTPPSADGLPGTTVTP